MERGRKGYPELAPVTNGPLLMDCNEPISTIMGLVKISIDKDGLRNQLETIANERDGQDLKDKVSNSLNNLVIYFATHPERLQTAYLTTLKRKPNISPTIFRVGKAILTVTVPIAHRGALGIAQVGDSEAYVALDIPRIIGSFAKGEHMAHIKSDPRKESFTQFLARLWTHEREHLFQFWEEKYQHGEELAYRAQETAKESDLDFLSIKF